MTLGSETALVAWVRGRDSGRTVWRGRGPLAWGLSWSCLASPISSGLKNLEGSQITLFSREQHPSFHCLLWGLCPSLILRPLRTPGSIFLTHLLIYADMGLDKATSKSTDEVTTSNSDQESVLASGGAGASAGSGRGDGEGSEGR